MAFSGLEKVGVAFLAVLFIAVVKCLYGFVYKYAIGPAINKVDFPSKGRWALVTGGTDGIGKAYAKALASRGCDIILVSRSLDKLMTIAEEIEKEFKVMTRVVQADFTGGDEIYDKIAQETEGLEIGTLVNNVGISYQHPDYFLEISLKEKENIIKANVVAVTRMCSLVMPGMLNRRTGVVINVGSASSCIPSPLLTAYAASKAYVEKLTEGLEMEYSNKGIIIQCVMPGFVVSNMSKLRKSSFLAPTARTYVASALARVGTDSKTNGYFRHSLLIGFINFVYSVAGSFAVWIVTRNMERVRLRSLKKYKKQ